MLADGKVGIGTTSPDQILECSKSTGTTLIKAAVGGNSRVGFEIEKTGATTQTWRIQDGQSGNGLLEIYDQTDSRSVMVFDGSGKVGLYTTTSPVAGLHQKSHSNGWEGGILLEEQNATTGWNIHPDNNNQLMIGRNTDTSTASATHVASFTTDGIRLPSGKGINFHNYGTGTGVSSNLLDDYEEGSHTPTLPTNSDGTSSADGDYTKVGNICVYGCSFTMNATSNTSHMKISLPFTAAGGRPGCGVVRYSTSPNWNELAFHVSAGSTTASVYELSGAAVTYAAQDPYRFDIVFTFRTA